MRSLLSSVVLFVAVLPCIPAHAQQPSPPPFKQPEYGQSISYEQAKTVAAAAAVEAEKNHWPSSIAIVGISGELIFFRA
jgi:hypothetical protein